MVFFLHPRKETVLGHPIISTYHLVKEQILKDPPWIWEDLRVLPVLSLWSNPQSPLMIISTVSITVPVFVSLFAICML